VRVLHVITRMIVGGAQENTLLSCALIDQRAFPSEILCGVETGAEGELHSECRARGVPLHLEPSLVRDLHLWKDLLALVRLVRFMRRGRYDVVHVHTSKAGILGRIAARLAGVPIVIHTAHGWAFSREQPKLLYWLYVLLERFCAALSDSLIVVSRSDQDEALLLRVGRQPQYVLIRSGIELDRYLEVQLAPAAARERIGLPREGYVVGTVGRLSRQKAPLDLLTAFQRLVLAEPGAHLVYVGDGPLRPELEAAIGGAGLTGCVHLLGLRRDIPEILRAFDVFALASRWEGLPRVFPQAMAAGLPIVATRVDGAADAVRDRESGWLVDVGDTLALAERLIELARTPARAREMGEAGRSRVEEFSARRMVDQLADLYRRLAEQKGLVLPSHSAAEWLA
jgi:glycosyltransferase involved in cell wall biosynthesis